MRHNNEPEKPRVYIEYDTTESGGEALDPDDRWSSHEPIHTTLEVKHSRRAITTTTSSHPST